MPVNSPSPRARRTRVLIVGSSFSGSLLAWILQSQGIDCLVIDRQLHPRFAIGESSTPTADMYLRYLAERWGIRELAPLSTYGTWKEAYPSLGVGLKRGFSYFSHQPNQPFQESAVDGFRNSYLVAASASDSMSDTHWYREDVDQFMKRSAERIGVEVLEEVELTSAEFCQGSWKLQLSQGANAAATADGDKCRGSICDVVADFVVDASGAAAAFASLIGVRPDGMKMQTRTGSLFAHFEGVGGFANRLTSFEHDRSLFFDADHAAQHHLTPNGWMWVLRFDSSRNDRTSVGWVLPESEIKRLYDGGVKPSQQKLLACWMALAARFPGIDEMLQESRIVAPDTGIGCVPRISRRLSQSVGKQWASLPSTFGVVDPLHSTGIAHALSGVSRLAEILISGSEAFGGRQTEERLHEYSQQLRRELDWIDSIVSVCYAAIGSFRRFCAASSFYFVSSIAMERAFYDDPNLKKIGFLGASDQEFKATLSKCIESLSAYHDDAGYEEAIRRSIEPWNTVGLLDPSLQQRLAHTIALK